MMANDMSKDTKPETKPEPVAVVEPAAAPEPVNATEQTEIGIANGWCAAGLITAAERDQRLAAIRRRYHGGR